MADTGRPDLHHHPQRVPGLVAKGLESEATHVQAGVQDDAGSECVASRANFVQVLVHYGYD